MDDAQHNRDATALDTGNVMDRVLETLDGIGDNATAAIGTGVSKIGAAGAGLADKAGTLAGDISIDSQSLGETAGGIAGSIGDSVSQGFDAAVTFARGLFGG